MTQKNILFLLLVVLSGHSIALSESKWVCSGYCFLGGDAPVNPWVPVSSEGATEQEARDKIDCGAYQEVEISCKVIAENWD